MPLVKAQCTNCGGKIEVNSEAEHLICKFCGMEFVVQDAINTYNTSITNNNTYNIASANIALDGFNEKDELNNAKNMIKLGDFEGAIKKYEDIYIHNPNNANASLLKNSEKFDIDKVWNTVKTLTQEGSNRSDIILLLIYKHKSEFAMAFNKSEIDFNEFLKITKDFIDQNLLKELVNEICVRIYHFIYNSDGLYNLLFRSTDEVINKKDLKEFFEFHIENLKGFRNAFDNCLEDKKKFFNKFCEILNTYKQSLILLNMFNNEIERTIDYFIKSCQKIINTCKTCQKQKKIFIASLFIVPLLFWLIIALIFVN